MTAFTVIVGIATLLGFILQVRDVFPSHRETRRTLVILLAGVFLGSFVGLVGNVRATTFHAENPVQAVATVLLACVLLFVVGQGLRLMTDSQPEQRAEAANLATAGFLFLLMAFVVAAMAFSSNRSPMSIDESLILVAHHRTSRNFDRALELIEQARLELRADDIRRESLKNLADQVSAEQAALAVTP